MATNKFIDYLFKAGWAVCSLYRRFFIYGYDNMLNTVNKPVQGIVKL